MVSKRSKIRQIYNSKIAKQVFIVLTLPIVIKLKSKAILNLKQKNILGILMLLKIVKKKIKRKFNKRKNPKINGVFGVFLKESFDCFLLYLKMIFNILFYVLVNIT